MKAETVTMTGLFVIQWLDFPTGNRAFGGGGWSRNAKYRPAPQPFQQVVSTIEQKGKSFVVDGRRRLKLNIYDAAAGKWLRTDYSELREAFDFHSELNAETKVALRSRIGHKPMILGGVRSIVKLRD